VNQLDMAGVYRGEILESALGETKKGFPQAVLRLKALEKWVEDLAGMKHFDLTEPGWVDWSSFDENIVAYLVLFNSTEVFEPGQTDLKNYGQLKTATGWNGEEFDSLGDGALIGKKLLFRLEDHEYQGKLGLQVNWIDAWDAPPTRELKSLDAAAIKNFNSKLKITRSVRPASAPAKPAAVVKPPAPSPSVNMGKMAKAQADAAAARAVDPMLGAGVSKPTTATPAAAETGSSMATPLAATKRSPGRPRKNATVPPPPPAPIPVPAPVVLPPAVDESPDLSTGFPGECTQIEGWDHVCNNKGDNSDTDIEKAWIDSCTEVGGDKDEAEFTPADWARVRDLVIKDLAL